MDNIKLVHSDPTSMYQNGLHKTFLKLTLPSEEGLNPQMAPRFYLCVNESKYNAKTILVYAENIPIAWALLFDYKSSLSKLERNIFMYVRSDWRRKGIGTLLIEEAIKTEKKTLTVSKWSTPSKKFYENFSSDTEDSDRVIFTTKYDNY